MNEEIVQAARFHLSQINLARPIAPLSDPIMAEFVANLGPINTLADSSPGFVWRLQTEHGDATALRPYDDDRIIVNLSVWEDLESLRGFVYRSAHAHVMKRRREWFDRLTGAYIALWWIPAGHRPTVEEGVPRVEHLKQHGPTLEEFSFGEFRASPGAVNL